MNPAVLLTAVTVLAPAEQSHHTGNAQALPRSHRLGNLLPPITIMVQCRLFVGNRAGQRHRNGRNRLVPFVRP